MEAKDIEAAFARCGSATDVVNVVALGIADRLTAKGTGQLAAIHAGMEKAFEIVREHTPHIWTAFLRETEKEIAASAAIAEQQGWKPELQHGDYALYKGEEVEIDEVIAEEGKAAVRFVGGYEVFTVAVDDLTALAESTGVLRPWCVDTHTAGVR